MIQNGWVIERYMHDAPHYWNGRERGNDFSPQHEDAVRFARLRDAARVLEHQLGGLGRVVECQP